MLILSLEIFCSFEINEIPIFFSLQDFRICFCFSSFHNRTDYKSLGDVGFIESFDSFSFLFSFRIRSLENQVVHKMGLKNHINNPQVLKLFELSYRR